MAKADPARQARDRLLRLERQARAQAEARAVMDGVAETVALSRARGAAIETPGRGKARAQPVRRLSGLEWLLRKGRLSVAEAAAGERYGQAYRRAKLDPAIPSTLEVQAQTAFSAAGPSLKHLVARAHGTAQASELLAGYRRRLLMQPDLIGACDEICGEERTPREAAGGDRDGARLEAVLKVALNILAQP
ncbi:hypothetical protein [Phenylobacterium sp.]|uniref:hypothetical protein n=1 Tax=Phenylobacterium sp. TaxID=1871053 RepID=UPI0028116470|nr:hypothetical protein [Phenylobacterium sp.]